VAFLLLALYEYMIYILNMVVRSIKKLTAQ
jgi:hypothetical protein